MAQDDTWFPPTTTNPLPVVVVDKSAPNVKNWFPPSGVDPLPVYITGGGASIPEPPDNQLYGRRGPTGSGAWSLISLAAGPPEAPTDGAIYGRGRVSGSQAWAAVLPLAGGTLTGPLILGADPTNPLGAATKNYVDNVGAIAGGKVSKSGDTMTGPLTLSADPSLAMQAATKGYVDGFAAVANAAVPLAGGTMTGLLVLSANPTNNLGAVTKQYADAISTVANAALPRAGGTMTGVLTLAADPAAALQPATKQYVDGIGTTAAAAVRRSGDTMTGLLVLSADPTAALGAVTKQYADAIMAVAQDGVDIHGDTMTGKLVISFNSSPLPATGTDTLLQLGGANGTTSRILLDVFGPGVTANFTLRAARGSAAAPSALQTNDGIGQFAFFGYGATGYSVNRRASIQGRAAENWTDTAQGTFLDFLTTPIGGTLTASAMTIARGVMLGGPVDGDLGSGTLNAATLLQVNQNAAAAPPVTAMTGNHLFRLVGPDGVNPRGLIDGFGAGVPTFVLRGAGGSNAAPTAVASAQSLGQFGWTGHYGAGGYQPQTRAYVQARATEGWDAGGQGLALEFGATGNRATTTNTTMKLGLGLMLGTPADGDLGVGWLNATSGLQINRNITVPPPSPFATTVFRIIGADGEAPSTQVEAFGGNPLHTYRRANGTAAAPSHLNAGENMGAIVWRGYGATAYGVNSARIACFTLESWTDTAQGSQLQFITCPVGQTVTTTSALLGPGLTVGHPALPPSGGTLDGDVVAQRLFASDPAAQLVVNRNTAAAPAVVQPGVQVVSVDGASAACEVVAAGNVLFIGRKYNGPLSAPTAVLNAQGVGALQGRGYGATAWSGARGAVNILAGENWSDTAQGTTVVLQTTANGTLTTASNLTLDGGGNLTIIGGTATKAGGGSWVAPSSLAVKRNVENYTRGLAELRQLQPISFEYNGEMGTIADGRRYVGLAAEAVAPLMPEMLSQTVIRHYRDDEVDEYPTVLLDPTGLTYALINAVYELETRVLELEQP